MKFNFRKIASVLASAVMLSSTVAIAAAANYPAPFVQNGAANVAIVYGSSPAVAVTDLVAVSKIQTQLSEQLAKQTATGGSSSGATATGGDSVNLGSVGSQKIYMNSSLNTGISVLTSKELPTLLADGSATDLTGTSYKYTQKITPGPSAAVTYGKSGENIDPIPLIQVGTSASTPLLNYTLTLSKSVNITDTTNVVGTTTFKILGQDFTVGANSGYSDLYLYGSGVRASVDEGDTKTIKVNGVDHTVTFKGASSTTQATVIVDGVQKTVTKGSSYKFTGEFEIYIKDIYYTTKTGTLSNIDLLVGSRSLHIVNAASVRYGADDSILSGTLGNLSFGSGLLSSVTVAQAASDPIGDYIAKGGAFTDRVFNGAFKVQFAGLSSDVNDSTRDSIVIDTDNSVNAKIKFKTALSSGKEGSLYFAHDSDGTSDSSLSTVRLADSANYTIHVFEGESVNLSDYMVVNAGDKGRILQLKTVGVGYGSSDKTSFVDAITGDTYDFTMNGNSSSLNIDGQTYYIAIVPQTSANITWGSGAASGTPGSVATLFPRIQLPSGSWLAFAGRQTGINNNTKIALPGVDSLSTYESGAYLTVANATFATSTFGRITYQVNWTNTIDGSTGSTGILSNLTISTAGTPCIFNATTGPAILIQEEKTVIGSGSTNGDVICVPLTSEGTNTLSPAIGTPVFSDGSTISGLNLASNTNKAQTMDIFGTFIERDTTNNNVITVQVPSQQMFADVLVTSGSATVTPGSSGSGSVKSLGSVMYKDSEASSISNSNLIVVGGSCINTVAAELLGSSSPLCGANFEQATGVGANSFLIQTFSRSGGKVATLVAGYNADDTTNAGTYLTTQTVDTTVGKKYVGTSATQASLVTTTA